MNAAMSFKICQVLRVKVFGKKLGTIPASEKTQVAILIIRFSLLLMSASFAVFISVDPLLWLAVPGLPELMIWLGLATLISAFVLLLSTGLFVVIRLIIAACFDYFSATQSLQRQLLFVHAR